MVKGHRALRIRTATLEPRYRGASDPVLRRDIITRNAIATSIMVFMNTKCGHKVVKLSLGAILIFFH